MESGLSMDYLDKEIFGDKIGICNWFQKTNYLSLLKNKTIQSCEIV